MNRFESIFPSLIEGCADHNATPLSHAVRTRITSYDDGCFRNFTVHRDTTVYDTVRGKAPGFRDNHPHNLRRSWDCYSVAMHDYVMTPAPKMLRVLHRSFEGLYSVPNKGGRSHVSKIGGVFIPQLTTGSEECRKLPQWSLGADPQPQTILGRFMCNFMRF